MMAVDDAGARMDAVYRRQRHIYDLSRKFYLFGRDRLLRQLPAPHGASVLEIGCGTGRNLIALARRRKSLHLFGVDASGAMLATASRAIERAGLADRIRLAQADALAFDPCRAFEVEAFDTVYFSYVLSMIDDWRGAVDGALTLVRPGGRLAVVDFGDQERASAIRRTLLLAWLRLFQVRPRAEIEQGLTTLAADRCRLVAHENILAGYAYLVMLEKAAPVV